MYVIAHSMTMPTYVTNLVFLIGLGIAIDYSLLIVYRFREELWRGLSVEEAVVKTMQTAGRAVIFSGATVAIGLALLLFMPLPFIRAIGSRRLPDPGPPRSPHAATLQPALLVLYGRRGTRRVPVAAFLADACTSRFTARSTPTTSSTTSGRASPARSCSANGGMSPAIGALLVVGTIPVAWLQLTPGATAGIPQSPQSVQGLNILQAALGPGAIAPAQVLVDGGRAGGVRAPAVQAAILRLVGELSAIRRSRRRTTREWGASSIRPGGLPR